MSRQRLLLFPPTIYGLASLLMVCHPSATRAEMAWPIKAIELQGDAKSTVLEARFPFSNAGNTPVDITQVESSCGCTAATVEKRHFEPREKGEIVARFTVGTQTGVQTKTVLVATNDGQEPTTLTLRVRLPEVVRLQPGSVSWKHGEPATPKPIVLEVPGDTPADEVSVRSSADGFQAAVKALAPGRKYEVTVRPSETGQSQASTLTIRCRFGSEEKFFYAYASVRSTEAKD